MKLKLAGSVACLALALAFGMSEARPKRKPRIARIGVVFDGPYHRNAEILALFKKEIIDVTRGEFEVRFPGDKHMVGDWTPAGVEQAVDHLLADRRVDIVLAMGVLASNAAGKRKRLRKPVIAPFMLDRELQGLPFEEGVSGRKNLSYLVWPGNLERDFKAFRDVVEFDEVVFLCFKRFVDAAPGLEERARDIAQSVGLTLRLLPVGDSVDEVLAGLPADARAVYLPPLPHLPLAEHQRLIDALNARKVPTFSGFGESDVKRGVLVATRPESDFVRIARRVALNVQRILLGDNAGTLEVNLKGGERLVINMKTARAIGHYPSWAVLTEAQLIDARRDDVARKLTLRGVMEEARRGNVDIKAVREAVAAGRHRIQQARANLLPQVDASTTARTIDRDRADAGFGNSPQHLWDGDVSFTQVLYSEGAWAGYDIEKKLQKTRELELEETTLDVVFEVAVAYLNVLRANTLEDIRKRNLQTTRSNLDLSRNRVDIGTASRAELYRWEAQIADDRKAVIEASTQRNLAEIQLNRILHRPPEESFSTEEQTLGEPDVITKDKRLFGYVKDPWTFKVFRRFMLEEAIARSPEIRRLNAAIAVQERAVTSARRALWSPTLALTGSLTQRFARGGAGTDWPPGGAAEPNSTQWFVGLNLSVPVFEGGARKAAVDEARSEVKRLQYQRDAVRDLIGQRIAAVLHRVGSSYAGIRLSREAATAAVKNLDLVTDAYGKGAVSIIELLDAQTAALNAEQVAANAVYDFLIEWMEVQRAIGEFELFQNQGSSKAFFDRADAYVKQARASSQ